MKTKKKWINLANAAKMIDTDWDGIMLKHFLSYYGYLSNNPIGGFNSKNQIRYSKEVLSGNHHNNEIELDEALIITLKRKKNLHDKFLKLANNHCLKKVALEEKMKKLKTEHKVRILKMKKQGLVID